MATHAPAAYDCPFCRVVGGGQDKYTNQDDVVYNDQHVTAVVAPRWWVNNAGSVLVFPNQHHENIYTIADDVLARVYQTVKRLSIAIRESYGCQGVSNRQHNEPAGGQDVWHLHVQVLPRYLDDELYKRNEENRFVAADERAPYAVKLRDYLAKGGA